MELEISSGFLFDTNILIAALAGEQQVKKFLIESKQPVYFSTITECEVFSKLEPVKVQIAESMFSPAKCIAVDSEIARMAAGFRRQRRLKTPDALILATAKARHLTLVSRGAHMKSADEFGVHLISTL
ncbi:type II toxin-antitoxin system VapC family toxin [Alicyclobacillus sp. ALC3]|uniref:type II toxin-antitoxin system VapC family toxin n=1 Tax=Alicyclobacillus sp. ALC3 TaxID=2796143 RepID=UPI0023797E80|nr:type II toxin-antitoxin system VapC family toxin [Alicyclobacillus sp. ALC3]WDL96704.1 type II toxin-antitoxin system VapC family toxin [Alicyclobacillus sp. ALC3]